jgi:hypothetical protein
LVKRIRILTHTSHAVGGRFEAAKMYPEKTKQELVRIADELVKQVTSRIE